MKHETERRYSNEFLSLYMLFTCLKTMVELNSRFTRLKFILKKEYFVGKVFDQNKACKAQTVLVI